MMFLSNHLLLIWLVHRDATITLNRNEVQYYLPISTRCFKYFIIFDHLISANSIGILRKQIIIKML